MPDQERKIHPTHSFKIPQPPLCRKLQRDLDDALDEVAKAERKAELEAKLDAARKRLSSQPPREPSDLAQFLAASVGVNKGAKTAIVTEFSALLALVMIELLAHLAGAGTRLIRRGVEREADLAKPAEFPGKVVLLSRADSAVRKIAGV